MPLETTPPFGTAWRNIKAGESTFILSHLRPFDLILKLEDGDVKVMVAFGHHVFTDEKEVGPPFVYNDEKRFLSQARINRSVGLPPLLEDKFIEEHSRACRNQHGGKQFFMLQESDWAIFYDLRLRNASDRTFTMRVITAYTLDEASRLSIPGTRNALYRNEVILARLLNGETLNHDSRSR